MMMNNNEINYTQNDNAFKQRITADDRLDNLYMREMRCPYCQTKILRGTSKCKNCGLTKEQIYYAKLTAPYKPGRNILMSKVRPAELPFWKMATGGVFGFLGVHCFVAKRYLRGAIMLLLSIALIVELVIFQQDNAIRRMFEDVTYLFPGDLIGIIMLGMWVWDLFAIFLRQFKYPVVIDLGEEK